ncbi:hypothetical protein [Streptomyces acidiscabies]|nr:hypothetical protein [Streptomyces acidiscabies]
MRGGQVLADERLKSRPAGRQRAVPRDLRAEFLGDDVGDEVVPGLEVA